MNREELSHLAHDRHPIACPFSDATVEALLDSLVLPRAASILDIGCGRGEWTARLLLLHPHAKAVAVDRSELALTAAGERARAADVKDRLVLFNGDGADYLSNSGAAHDLIVCAGSDHVFGSVADAWKTLRSHLAPEGLLLLAQGFWTAEPSAAALRVLGENLRDELPVGVDALVDEVLEQGMRPLAVTVSSQREWDDYEWSWIGSLEEHARSRPEEEARELRDAAAKHREGYLKGYRGLLGFAAVIARRVG